MLVEADAERGTRDLSIFPKNALTFQSKTPSKYFVPYGVQDSLDRWSTDHERGNCAGLELSSVPEDPEYPVVWHQLHQILQGEVLVIRPRQYLKHLASMGIVVSILELTDRPSSGS